MRPYLCCHVSRRLFWAIEMFTKDQNHRTLFREAECKRILLQFALGYLKPICLRRPQRRGANRNGCFFCQQGKVSRWIGFNISKQNSALKIFSLHFLGFCLTKMLNFEIWVQVMSLFQRSDYNLIIIIFKSVSPWSVHDWIRTENARAILSHFSHKNSSYSPYADLGKFWNYKIILVLFTYSTKTMLG